MNTQDKVAHLLGQMMIEKIVMAEQLEAAASRIAELEKLNDNQS